MSSALQRDSLQSLAASLARQSLEMQTGVVEQGPEQAAMSQTMQVTSNNLTSVLLGAAGHQNTPTFSDSKHFEAATTGLHGRRAENKLKTKMPVEPQNMGI